MPRSRGAGRHCGSAPGPDPPAADCLHCFRAQSSVRRDASVSRQGDDGPGTRGRLRLHQELSGTETGERYSAPEPVACLPLTGLPVTGMILAITAPSSFTTATVGTAAYGWTIGDGS